MKNYKQGFASLILLIIIAVAVIGAGVYIIAKNNKTVEILPSNLGNATQTPVLIKEPEPSPSIQKPQATSTEPHIIYKPKPRLIPKPSPVPTPIPIPENIQTVIYSKEDPRSATSTYFSIGPKFGPPPLNVGLGLFFDENSSIFKDITGYSVNYGDDSHDQMQRYCWRDSDGTSLSTSTLKCQVRSSHTYTSSGAFTATLYGINAGGSSEILGTAKITVGNPLHIVMRIGDQEGKLLIKKINPDSVEGSLYYPTPVGTFPWVDHGISTVLHIGADVVWGCGADVSDILTSIDYSKQTVTFTKTVDTTHVRPCPVCLSGKTLIDTPTGSVLVKDLQIGMSVWTTDKAGHRIVGVVEKTSRIPVPPTHQMVHLVLEDKREVFVSPGHPTADARIVGNLVANDLYDGSRVLTTERVAYDGGATYDILPSGETGFYWADGILLGSTLHQ